MLAIMLLPSFSRRRVRLTAAEVVPLTVGCLALTALAVSTKVSAGSIFVADLDPHAVLSQYLAVFRGSARLFWAPYYVFLTAILAMAFTLWRPRKAAVLMTVALLVQFADTLPLRRWVGVQVSQSLPQLLRSPQWASLGKDHANLLVCLPGSAGYSRPILRLPADGPVIISLECWPCPSTCAQIVIMRRAIRQLALPTIVMEQ